MIIKIWCTLVRSPPWSLPLNPLPDLHKAIPRGFFVLFHISIWSPLTVFPHLHLLCSHSPLLQVPSHTVPILQSCLSLLIFKLMFTGVCQCVSTVGVVYFGQFNPFHCSPLPFTSHPSFFNSFQNICFYPLPSQMLCFTILLTIILFSFHSFPPTHSSSSTVTNMFYICLCMITYVYLLDLSST
jgi:hypothetical protein